MKGNFMLAFSFWFFLFGTFAFWDQEAGGQDFSSGVCFAVERQASYSSYYWRGTEETES